MFKFLVAVLVSLAAYEPALAQRKDVMQERPVAKGPTYGRLVEIFCEAYVFPTELKFKGEGVSRDNVIAERVERDGNNWWISVRARYSGRIFGVGVAERVRVEYDNGAISVDLGGLKGVINTGPLKDKWNDWFKKESRDTVPVPLSSTKPLLVLTDKGKVHIHDVDFSRNVASDGSTTLSVQGEVHIGAAKPDRLVLAMGNSILVITDKGLVHVHDVDFAKKTASDGSTILDVANKVPVGAADVDRWVLAMDKKILVITKEGRVHVHSVDLARKTASDGSTVLQGAPVAASKQDRWVLAMGNRILVITDKGKVHVHEVNFEKNTVTDGSTVLNVDNNVPVAATPQDRWVLAAGNRILVITDKGRVHIHEVDFTKMTATDGSATLDVHSNVPVAGTKQDKWVITP